MEDPIVSPREFLPNALQTFSNKSGYRCNALSTERSKQAKAELGEDPTQRYAIIQRFRTRVQGMSIDCPTDSDFLLMFLRARKFNIERATKLLKNYITMRDYNAGLFNIPMSEMGHVIKQEMQFVLPDKDKSGCPIFVFRAGRWNPNECSLEDIFRVNVACLEKLVEDPETQITGVVCILDLQNLSLCHIRHFTPSYAKKVIALIQDAFPARFKGIHLVNEPFIFGVIYSVTWPFLSEKMRSRIHCHGKKLSSLHNFVDPEVLPTEYGGSKADIDTKAIFRSMGV